MKTKIILGLVFSVFLLASLSLVLGLSLTGVDSVNLNQFENSSSFTLTLEDNSNISVDSSSKTINDDSNNQITLTILPDSYNNVSSANFNVTATGDLKNFELGKYSKTFTFSAVNVSDVNDTTTKDIKVNFEKSFCDFGNLAGLEIYRNRIDLNVEEGYGKREDYWYPLDEVEIEFELDPRNFNVEEIEDIEIEILIYDERDGRFVLDERDMDLSDDDFDLDEDDNRITITASFKIDPDDLTPGNTDYIVYVKATGEIKDDDEDLDGKLSCISESEDIEIRTDEEFVIFDNIEMPEIVNCGDQVEVSFDLWNIGDDDIDEDDIFVLMYNDNLEIYEVIDVQDLRELDKETVRRTITIPEDAKGFYELIFEAYDDEDLSNRDIYENEEDDEARDDFIFEVRCEEPVVKDVLLTPSLETGEKDVKAGKDVQIRVNVKNTGDEETSYTIGVKGNELFSSVKNINPSSVTLMPGESRDVLVELSLNKDVSGDRTFDITGVFNGQEVSQTVSLNIEEGFSFNFGNLGDSVSENWFIWVIVGINVILIIAIIIVAIRISRG